MNPLLKIHFGSAAYCALLAGLNWARSTVYSRQVGLQRESYGPVPLAILLSGATVLYLIYLCLRSALGRLETGRRVRPGRWIESRIVVLYALPLLWHRITTSSWVESDGALANSTGGYGYASSGWIFVNAVLALLLFQILARLTGDDEDTAPDSVNHSRATLLRA